MAVFLSPVFGVAGQLFDDNGNPLAGGKIYTYLAGTTTPAATYTTSAGSITHTNPIVLDGAGRVPSGEIWLTDGITYKFVVEDANNVLIGTYDNLVGINSNFVAYSNSQEIQTATAGQTVFNLTTMQYQPGTNSLSVFVDGVNQYGPGAQYAYVETDSDTVTFVSGLHVGASVKFTTSQLNSSGATDAALVTYNPPFIDGVSTNVEAKLSQYVSVKDFGAVGNGTVDDTAAFNNAILALKNTSGGGYPDQFSASYVIFVPEGVYKITAPINLYSGMTLQGEGAKSVISEESGFSGAALIVLTNSNNTVTMANVVNLGLQTTTTSGITVDNAASTAVGNCRFADLTLDCVAVALNLIGYFQFCDIANIYSYGNVDTILRLQGNANNVSRIDKERGGTGTSADPYILLDVGLVECRGNVLRDILIEGVTDANKTAITLDGAEDTHIYDIWIEPTNLTQGILLNNCVGFTRFSGRLLSINNAKKINVVNSTGVVIEQYYVEGVGVQNIEDYLAVDATSRVFVEHLLIKNGTNLYLQNNLINGKLIFDDVTLVDNGSPAGYSNKQTLVLGSNHNYVKNPSFEGGQYQWTLIGSATWSGVAASPVSKGLYGYLTCVAANDGLFQTVNLGSDLVGKEVTITCWARHATGAAGTFASIYVAGPSGTPAYNTGISRCNKDNEWCILTASFIVANAGNHSIGVRASAACVLSLDDFSVSVSPVAYAQNNSWEQIELGQRSMLSAGAIPTTGTWKVGDIVFNNAPAPSGTIGWVCTTAGTPGTWKTFGTIAA